MARCEKCDFSYDPATMPGGLCPRCLLLGSHDSRFESNPGGTSPEPATSLEDDELAEELPNFELVEHLGKGGMGVVWKARERVLNRHVAIKLLRNARNDDAFVERFTREACVMAQLNHPNIVTLFTFGRTRSNHCYLVMEMVDGMDLAQLLSKNTLDVATTLAIINDVCDALRHAHDAGFVHRDIKPANVLIDRHGRVKVADFGLARLTHESNTDTLDITKRGWAVGTPHYTAPEQANGRGDEDHRADIYSLGVMLYQMLTGELPRGIFRPPSLKQKVDKRLDKVVLKALQEEPEKRYQHVDQLVDDVQKIRDDVDPELIQERKDARHATRWRQRFEMGLAISLSLVLGIMGAWYAREWLSMPGSSRSVRATLLPDGGVTASVPSRLSSSTNPVVTREIRLRPPALSKGSLFGRSVSMAGDWLAVGAPNDVSQDAEEFGAVYIYRRQADGNWQLLQCLSNPYRGEGARFGHEVCISGNRLVVASPRHGSSSRNKGGVTLYDYAPALARWRHAGPVQGPSIRSQATSVEVHLAGHRLLALDSLSPYGASATSRQFSSLLLAHGPEELPLSGPVAVTGVPTPVTCAMIGEDEFVGCLPGASGGPPLMHARFATGQWDMHTPFIAAPDAGPEATAAYQAIAASRQYVLAGSPKWDHLRGLVWLLRRDSSGGFVHDAYLRPPPEYGSAEFGKSVAIFGDWAAIGADHCAVEDAHRGAVCLYQRTGAAAGPWEQRLFLPSDPRSGAAGFGYSVALTPGVLAVGAPYTGLEASADPSDMDTATGAVFIYEFATTLP